MMFWGIAFFVGCAVNAVALVVWVTRPRGLTPAQIDDFVECTLEALSDD